jgi:hypothetical protein
MNSESSIEQLWTRRRMGLLSLRVVRDYPVLAIANHMTA